MQEKIDFWNNVYGFTMMPIRELALSEALVDSVTADLVNTTAAKLSTINIGTMAASDIPFESDFVLRASRDDRLHAIVLWFDIHFDCSHKPVRSASLLSYLL
jgi:type I protein arginine methyltransferase